MMRLISWIGTLTSIAGSFAVAMHIFLVGYSLFLVGSISWLIVGMRQKNMPLITLNGTFFIANILGWVNAW